jgi:suppressor of tumorigenicity protein 13
MMTIACLLTLLFVSLFVLYRFLLYFPVNAEVLESYIGKLKTKISDLGGEDDEPETADAEEKDEFPPLYSSGDDTEQAGEYKQQAADKKSEGNWEEALDLYTKAVLAAPPSALLYANRAIILLKLSKHKAAERDCNAALALNPDSAKALRVRGTARKEMEHWEGALHDLSQAQAIDFDPDAVEDLKFLSEKHVEHEKVEAQERIEKEAKLRKRADDIKAAKKEAKQEEAEQRQQSRGAGGGMGGMPGGMGGMPGGMGGLMELLMTDPELQEAMKNPKVVAAFSELMQSPGGAMGLLSDPSKMQELMGDPEVGPVLQKILAKLGPGMMGGASGGMPGGGMGGGGGDADDIPNLDDLPDLD